MTEMIRIDSRVTGFSDEPIRLMAMCFQDTGEILLQKTEILPLWPYRQICVKIRSLLPIHQT